jgi:SNF2 family DNA or RNA helicase
MLELAGGDPRGRDTLHEIVSGWPGWQRLAAGSAAGSCSLYRARAWPAALLPLLKSSLAVSWQADAAAWRDEQVRAMHAAEAMLLRDPDRDEGTAIAVTSRTPMPHQVQAIKALAEMDAPAFLADDMGLGKTTTALLTWYRWTLNREGQHRLLIVCPKSVKLNWMDELATTLPVDLCYLIDGSTATRANVIGYMRATLAAADAPRRLVAIVNYDLLRSMNELSWNTMQLWVHEQAVICDEFHYCKDNGSKRTGAVKDLAHRASFRLGLTGTPVRNTVEDLFSQVEILRPGTWTSYHDFASRHLVVVPQQFGNRKRPVNVVRGGKNLPELNAILNTMRVGRKKEDVLSLPPKIHTKPLLELDGVHLDIYKQLKDFARIEIEKLMGESSAAELPVFHPTVRSALEAAMRCEMLAQGFISGLPEFYMERIAPMIAGRAERVPGYKSGAFVFPDSAKMDWLIELLEVDLKDRQVAVISRFNAPLYWLADHFKGVRLTGDMDAVARQEAIQAFQAGRARTMFLQVKLAEGFNLTAGQDVIFLGRDWSPAINAQAEGRFHRIGQKGTVNVQIPIMHNTIERMIDRKLAAKDADAQQALKALTLRELMEAL